jgi:hypothetical protein
MSKRKFNLEEVNTETEIEARTSTIPINKSALVASELQQAEQIIYVLGLRLKGATAAHNQQSIKQISDELSRQRAYADILNKEMEAIS